MTKAEIATYVGMASVMMAEATKEGTDDMMCKIREALMAAQLILMQQAIEEATSGNK